VLISRPSTRQAFGLWLSCAESAERSQKSARECRPSRSCRLESGVRNLTLLPPRFATTRDDMWGCRQESGSPVACLETFAGSHGIMGAMFARGMTAEPFDVCISLSQDVRTPRGLRIWCQKASRCEPESLRWQAPPCGPFLPMSFYTYGRRHDHPAGNLGLRHTRAANAVADVCGDMCRAQGVMSLWSNSRSDRCPPKYMSEVFHACGFRRHVLHLGKFGHTSQKPTVLFHEASPSRRTNNGVPRVRDSSWRSAL
jgi:hypothetical protein